MQTATPVIKDLVLVGGGHSHVAVLKAFGMRPLSGARITLISRGTRTPYSGMLPGLIAGHYSVDQAHIDLIPLARFAGARFFHDEVVGVDPQARVVHLAHRPPVAYDVLSINSGSTPSTDGVTGAAQVAVPVKPIDQFLGQWERILERLESRRRPTKIGVVGGGAGGVELALAIKYALASLGGPSITLELVTADADILLTHHRSVGRRFRRVFAERGIPVHTEFRVAEVRQGMVLDGTGQALEYDEILWVTQAGAPNWLSDSGLELDDDGFLLVNDCLQSISHGDVFGAGDAAAMGRHPRPKSGVFAVRQGPPLSKNLRRALLNRAPSTFRPQRRFLSLISTGGKYAVASRGSWSTEGEWVWTWKDWIDRRWMRKYQELPQMSEGNDPPPVPAELLQPHVREQIDDTMRCGGCGAKVGADVLTEALTGIEAVPRDDVVVGLNEPDDAALIAVPAGKLSVLSVDAFRPMIDDPFIFGKIAANHCLGDLFAMGAEAQSAMTIVTLPLWPEEKLIDELKQMLAGALEVFRTEGAALVGGHTSEGAELSLGFSVTGLIDADRALHKATLKDGDVLVLTKPLGTGTILAADMRAKARGPWVEAALASMLQSNRAAGDYLLDHGATACTDVTGFGVLGHLLEMIAPSSLQVTLDLDALPLLVGAVETSRSGILSSLHPKNERAARRISAADELKAHSAFPMLFDPQTAGGLLAGLPAGGADTHVAALRELGYAETAIIGAIQSRQKGACAVLIR